MYNLKKFSVRRTVVLDRIAPIFLLLISCFSVGFGQTIYYVATSGSDNNTGRSIESPFQTIAKVNSLSLQPGDQILFRRNDTFRGSLQLRNSGSSDKPIVIDAYGSGNKPVLAASVPVSNWTNIGNGTWQANCPSCGSQVTGVYRNGSVLPLGRYPNLSDANKGYLTVQSHSGKTQLTSQQGFSTDWTGGEVVVRPVQWILDRASITNQNGNTLILANNSTYDITDGWGFFIQNHPATLDQSGEWYYNPINKTIRLYDNQNDPNNQLITATAFSEGVNLTNASFITIRNLQITQTLNIGLLASGCSNLTLSGNDVTNSGVDGIAILGTGSNVLLENNLIEDANNNGFHIDGYQNFTARGNTIQRIGVIPGRGKSGDGTYSGLHSSAVANVLIENNVLDHIGYNGMSIFNNTIVRNNVVSNFCQTKSDGSGIYSWNGNHSNSGGLHIVSNIVFNGLAALEGMVYGTYSGANGIFLDDCSQNSEIVGNTTFNSRGKGILLRATSNVTVRNNTSFNNNEEQFRMGYNDLCTFRNNVVQDNIFFSRLPDQGVVAYESNANDLNQYGQFDNNYYVRPFEDQFKIWMVYNPGSGLTGKSATLTEWQAKWGQDRNSFNSPITYKTKTVGQVGASVLNHSFAGDINGWNVWSPYGNGRVDWDNTNRLDGGSLRLSFNSASNQNNAYLLATVSIGTVAKGKTYQLLFDGIASASGKRIQVFPRQLVGNYSDLAARASFVVGNGRQSYEATFTATADESNAILVIQVEEDGQTAWLDNIRLQEATLTDVNPDDYIKLIYNPTFQNKVESIDGVYRDVKNNTYTNQVTVAPFSSLLLMKEVNTTPPPPPSPTLRDPENPSNAVAGLDYSYYEGNWSSLPDFTTLASVKTGTSSIPTRSVRNKDYYFALRFTGYVSVPTDGVYTFYISSDDGSKLFIGTTEVVNNDGGHAEQERSGTIGLKAGLHALTIPYFQGGGDQALTVSYSGPGLNKQPIPASNMWRVAYSQEEPQTTLRDADNPANTTVGLDYSYYEGNWSSLPDFNALSPVKTGISSTPTLAVRNREDNFGLRFTGYINVPTDGVYSFYTSSDDGSKLFIGTTEVVNNDGGHAEQERSGTIGLKAGVHAITILYYEGPGDQALTVRYAGPGLGKQVIPASAFWRLNTTASTSLTGHGLRAEYFNNTTLNAPIVLTRTDANVDFDWGYGSPASGTISVDNFSIRWTGQVEAPVTGSYVFSTNTDDGVRLWVNGIQLVNDWNGHAPTTNNGTSLNLTAGQRYDIRMEYFEGEGGAVARLLWSYPGQGQQVVPKERLYAATTPSARLASFGESDSEINLPMLVYPTPAQVNLWIRYQAETTGEATIQLINTMAQPILQTQYPIAAGNNLIKLDVGQLNRGHYILILSQGNKRISRKVLLRE
ncbi:PA14 domain-containing protein [Spirosoma validum]|uniref:Right-handed parallel beta-helix repeat-containing protein n=1 Tax=Spirosoma validum TaxID=2771355 RepID=A0A927GC42_9BACT|nr:PA14 domain-containing protein [Spirosoma validum]MBD2752274.1 right-handed parallel beta-helix repeat-containing protein [Spirosoma validum]